LSIVCHTKKYKYNRCKHNCKIKDVWGETIKTIAMVAALIMAMVAVPAIAQNAAVGTGGVDILGNGIFETGDSAFKFPILTDTNFDNIIVGNDYARAFGWGDPAVAQNNLEIKKNQNVGACASCCKANNEMCAACQDACTTVNIEQIEVGDRSAEAFGIESSAVNNQKIVVNQESA
jgi:hypothetical protein